jgi:hypothetical protein
MLAPLPPRIHITIPLSVARDETHSLAHFSWGVFTEVPVSLRTYAHVKFCSKLFYEALASGGSGLIKCDTRRGRRLVFGVACGLH